MTHNEKIDAVEKIFDYRFKSKDLLMQALIAAGIGEGDSYDGHRRLAQIGVDIIGVCLGFDGLQTKANSHKTATLRQQLCSYEHRVRVVQRTAIDKCVIYNPRDDEKSLKVAAKALAAIIAAIYLDCGSHQSTWERMQHIGFLVQQDEGVEKVQANGEIDNSSPSSQNQNESSLVLADGTADRVGTVVDPSLISDYDNPSPEGRAIYFWSENEIPGVNQPPNSNWGRFLGGELQKTRPRGLPTPDASYYTVAVQRQMLALKSERSIEFTRRLLLLPASSQSVVMLKEVVSTWRHEFGKGSWQPLHLLSKAARFEVLEKINQNITCLHLIQRYYILSLFEDCGGSDTPSFSGFIEMSGHSSAVKRLKGNPRNRAEAEVAEAMLKEMFPNLQQGTGEYEKRIAVMKTYRQLARKFSTLTKRFGRGIIALIPCNLQGHPDLGISDSMISRVPEADLQTIVPILERSQGEILRDFSAAALKVVEVLLSGCAQQCPAFHFEVVEACEILDQSKNSKELLQYLRAFGEAPYVW